jgi:thioredoxin 1
MGYREPEEDETVSDAYINVTDQTFQQQVLQSDKPVIVDFWAEWCGPCKMMAPHFEALANDYKGRMVFAKLDTDSNPGVPSAYGIRGIPTLLVFSGGKEVDRIVGAVPRDRIKSHIDNALAATA